jgi:hypothetical protein
MEVKDRERVSVLKIQLIRARSCINSRSSPADKTAEGVLVALNDALARDAQFIEASRLF